MQRQPGDSWDQRRPVDSGAATGIAFFRSRVIPAAFQLEVHAVFRAVAWRMEVAGFVALLRRASELMSSSRYNGAHEHLCPASMLTRAPLPGGVVSSESA